VNVRVDETYNSFRLQSATCQYSETVKQTTCSTADTSSTVVYKCRQCDRLFVSLNSLQEHRLDKHSGWNIQIGCGLCGNLYWTERDVKSCFYRHFIGCGRCESVYWTERDAKSCFYHHIQKFV